MKIYEQGDVIVLDIDWLTQTSEEASVTGTPTITIKRYNTSTNDWTAVITAQNMTVESGSTWFYEYDTSSQSANKDFKATYNAIIDGLSVEHEEDFRLVDIVEEIRQMRKGNERIDFTYTSSRLSSITIYTKADSDADWLSPTSTKTLYFTYDSNGRLTKAGEV